MTLRRARESVRGDHRRAAAIFAFILPCTGLMLLFLAWPAALVLTGFAVVWRAGLPVVRILRGAASADGRLAKSGDD